MKYNIENTKKSTSLIFNFYNDSIVSYDDMINNTNQDYKEGNYGGIIGSILDTLIVDNIELFNIPHDDIKELDDIWLSSNLIKSDWTISRSFLPPVLLLTSAGPNLKKNYLFNTLVQL